MDPDKKTFRFVLLSFNCLMTFGSYFCMDMTSVLQNEMQGTVNCTKEHDSVEPINNSTNVSCCQDCLYITPDQFNLLFAVRAWTIATIIPFSGFFIDKIGNKVGALLMSSIAILGNCLFAVGSLDVIRYSSFMLPTLIVGRFFLGIGEASTRIVQDRITAYWFRDKELSMAFGITLTVSRLGSVLNFFVSPNIAHKFGLTTALFFGVSLCGISFISCIIVSILDTYGVKKSGKSADVKDSSKNMKFSDIAKFKAEFWLIISTIMLFYAGFVPLVNNGSKYIHDMYDIDERKAAYITGVVFDLSIPLSPILGYVVDRFGGRYFYLILAGVLTLPAYIILDFTLIHPLFVTVWLGISYVSAAVGMWPCMPLMVDSANMGTALGLTIASQGLAVGATNAIVGKILGDRNSITNEELHKQWQLSLIPLCINMFLSSVVGFLAVILDRRRDKKLVHKPKTAQIDVKKEYTDEVTTEGLDPSQCQETDPLLSKETSSVN